MKRITPMLLLALSSQSFAYSIHESCSTNVAKVKQAMTEAVAILKQGYLRGTACAAWDLMDHDESDATAAELCTGPKKSDILGSIFGEDSTQIYGLLAKAFGPAADAPGPFSENDDGRVKVVCGDDSLNEINADSGYYRDKNHDNIQVNIAPAPGKGKRPCDVVDGLTWEIPNRGHVLMICDKPGRGINSLSFMGSFNNGDLRGKTVDFLALTVSNLFVHELIHIGDPEQFPKMLGPNTPEKYKFDGAKSLVDTDYKYKNCDSFTIVARAWYMNNWYVSGGEFKVLPKSMRPPNPNGVPVVPNRRIKRDFRA